MQISKNNIINGKELKSRDATLERIGEVVEEQYNVSSSLVVQGLLDREEVSSTGFENGIAIPHTKVPGLTDPQLYIVRHLDVDWQSMDGKNAEVVLSILVPEGEGDEHLKILANLSRRLVDPEFIETLKTVEDDELVELINSIFTTREVVVETMEVDGDDTFIVGVTACVTGIAHTYMAAENLTKAAQEQGYKVKIETRGRGGIENKLTKQDIETADYVIVATDVETPMDRFAGKKVLKRPVKEGVHHPNELIEEGKTAPVYVASGDDSEEESSEKQSLGQTLYKALLNGVNHMLPFTIAGGILIALSFVFGTQANIDAGVYPLLEWLPAGEIFSTLGGYLFGAMLAILAGYIAMSIGDRAAFMPGFLAGLIAAGGDSGFLGAILGGFLAGFLAGLMFRFFKRIPKSFQGSYQILFTPVILAIVVGSLMVGFDYWLGLLNTGLTEGLLALQDFSPILLGLIIGAMMASDMGGPINKAAYTTGVILLAEGNEQFIAAVMAAGMIPPLAVAFSTMISKSEYSEQELEAGKTNWVLGLSFITEGAIPFAAEDPKRVIPSLMLGAGVTGALTMLFGVLSPAPHGGIFVVPLITHPLLFLVAIAAGTVVGGTTLSILKKRRKA